MNKTVICALIGLATIFVFLFFCVPLIGIISDRWSEKETNKKKEQKELETITEIQRQILIAIHRKYPYVLWNAKELNDNILSYVRRLGIIITVLNDEFVEFTWWNDK